MSSSLPSGNKQFHVDGELNNLLTYLRLFDEGIFGFLPPSFTGDNFEGYVSPSSLEPEKVSGSEVLFPNRGEKDLMRKTSTSSRLSHTYPSQNLRLVQVSGRLGIGVNYTGFRYLSTGTNTTRCGRRVVRGRRGRDQLLLNRRTT